MIQLLCSQAKEKLQEELLKRNKHNLYVRPSAARCIGKGRSPSLFTCDVVIATQRLSPVCDCGVRTSKCI